MTDGCGPRSGVPCYELRMTPDEHQRSSDQTPAGELREHAEFRAREAPGGIGAAVIRSRFEDPDHVWECIVSDGNEWHYVQVIGSHLGASPPLSTEQVEEGIERFAATLPEQYRLHTLLNLNPLHVDPMGVVTS